ncbi:ferredoxin-type protein NapG [Campylobacter gastrosuis]|uniref:Ferredoxin-type protein NapG n=1 Tax=Campylobacter gastrosuis TaxID=2974576 RepID=A0ABT7HPZ7_9BACT|nr:ferredoxin-type protein NapG [Campylobacter gastrosuis]MDL0088992.1 ferredoxin-type protein NapG [Campylobacter gastrosuis]
MQRREVLKFSVKAISLAVAGGLIWQKSATASQPTLLRPPAAKSEKEFLASCIRCGLCVVACPFDTLKLAEFGSDISTGTPYFTPRKTPCYMCGAAPCVPACPTDALDIKTISKEGKIDISLARMGVAVVDMKNCVAFWGIQCDACYRACPLIDRAIKLEYRRNERTQKHAFLLPVVDSDVCTGCGVCERACITQKPAIIVFERDRALGAVRDDYIKGWDKKDEARIDDDFTPNPSIKKAKDYLNSGEF